MRIGRSILVVLAALVTALSMTVLPSAAARATFEDRVNDAPRRMDIRSVKVVNERRIAFQTEFRYLRDQDFYSIDYALYIDTNRRDSGPEYAVAGILFWEMFVYQVEGWRGPYEFLFCRGKVRARVEEGRFGTVTYNFPRGCLGRPDKIRVFAGAAYSTDSDLAPRRRTFYPAVGHD